MDSITSRQSVDSRQSIESSQYYMMIVMITTCDAQDHDYDDDDANLDDKGVQSLWL